MELQLSLVKMASRIAPDLSEAKFASSQCHGHAGQPHRYRERKARRGGGRFETVLRAEGGGVGVVPNAMPTSIMPGQAIIDAPGALHHIIARGMERREIFFDGSDRDDFLRRGALMNVKILRASPISRQSLVRDQKICYSSPAFFRYGPFLSG